MPIPADTIVGMYHPFRDVVWKGLTSGVPFKNFLITDAVRQQYPWRNLAIDLAKHGEYPGWNPYTLAGTPLVANIQSAVFYPLNILYFFLPFNLVWTIQVIMQPLILAVFMLLYLQELGITKKAALISSVVISLCGFSVAWLEWNTTLNTLVWLPFALLAIEKILKNADKIWYLALFFALVSILFAGFLQTAFYAYFFLGIYTLYKLKAVHAKDKRRRIIRGLTVTVLLAVIIGSVQWIPSIKLIFLSARDLDQGNVLEREDWFIPWQNLMQFVVPDFFGNPSTLNYWGVFNYQEYIGYIGILPIIFAISTLFQKGKNKISEQKIFTAIFISTLILATPNPIAKIPYLIKLPLISTAQPSRLMMLIDFSLIVLAAIGFDSLFRKLSQKPVKIDIRPLIIATILISTLILGGWLFSFFGNSVLFDIPLENLAVTKRNLILPSILLIASVLLFLLLHLFQTTFGQKRRAQIFIFIFFMLIFSLTSADLLRFARKFTPFSDPEFLYPQTETIQFLKSDRSIFRYMTTDRRILPPNFSLVYRLQTIEGYDPIYLRHFGQMIASAQKGEPTLESLAFNRIIRPDNFESQVYDVLNVKYVLSLRELEHTKLKKVFQEGETRVYENLNVFPRAFIIPNNKIAIPETETLKAVFKLQKNDIRPASILEYRENRIRILTDSDTGGMLVLTDVYYPNWKAEIDGSAVKVYRVFHALRGTIVPPGQHEVFYYYSQL